MRILVTRPREDAEAFAGLLRSHGHEPVVEPLLRIERRSKIDPPLELAGVQALLFTSANGVRAFAALSAERGRPAYAVGEASAAAARAAGFTSVVSADGDVGDLVRLVAQRLRPEEGALFHAAGATLAGDLQADVEAAGFTLQRRVLYEAVPAAALSPQLREELHGGRLDAAAFFSPRTAATFVRLVEEADLRGACARSVAVCLSGAVADELRGLPWADVLVAETPTQDALLARLDAMAAAAARIEAMPATPSNDESSMPGFAGTRAGVAGPGPAQDIVNRFGGIRPMASKLGIAVSTVQGWRTRGAIPAARHAQVLAAAREHGIPLEPVELSAAEHPAGEAEAPFAGTAPAEAPAEPSGSAAASAEAAVQGPTAEPARPAAAAEAVAASGRAETWWHGFAVGVLALAVGAAAAVLSRDLWLPAFSSPALETAAGAEVAALQERLAKLEAMQAADQSAGQREALDRLGAALSELEGQVSGLSNRLDALPKEPGDIAALRSALAGLEQRLGDLAAQGQRLDALAARLDELAARGPTARAELAGEAALALAALQLRDAVQAGGPFAGELALLRELAASQAVADGAALAEMVDSLAPHAETGVPSLAALQAEFPALARSLVAEGQGPAEDTWVDGALRRLSGLVTVRPVGPVEGTGAGAVVARAEARLNDGDLPAAVQELEALSGPAAAAAEPWLERARARLAAQRVLTQLGQRLIAQLEPAGG